MTGPINLFPNDSGSVLDNLSAITDNPNGGYDTIGNPNSHDYSVEEYSTDSSDQQSDNSQNQVEEYSETSHTEQSDSGQSSSESGSSSNSQNGEPSNDHGNG